MVFPDSGTVSTVLWYFYSIYYSYEGLNCDGHVRQSVLGLYLYAVRSMEPANRMLCLPPPVQAEGSARHENEISFRAPHARLNCCQTI